MKLVPNGENFLMTTSFGQTSYSLNYRSVLLSNVRRYFREDTPGMDPENAASQVQASPCSCNQCIVDSHFRTCSKCNIPVLADKFRGNSTICNACRSRTARRKREQPMSILERSDTILLEQKVLFDKEAYLLAVNMMCAGISKSGMENVIADVHYIRENHSSLNIYDPILPIKSSNSGLSLSPRTILRACTRYSIGTISCIILNSILTASRIGISSDQFQARRSKHKFLGVFLCGKSVTDVSLSVVNPLMCYKVAGESGLNRVIDTFSKLRTYCEFIQTQLPFNFLKSFIERGMKVLERLNASFSSFDPNFDDDPPSEYIFALFLSHIIAWVADSARSEVTAAQDFSDVRKGIIQKILRFTAENVPHLPDAAHILRSSIQHAFSSLKYIKPSKTSGMEQIHPEICVPKSLYGKGKDIAACDLFSNSMSPGFLSLLKKQNAFNNLITIPVNQLLSLPVEIRFPTKIGKPDISRQMSFDQNLLLFSYLLKHLDHYKFVCASNNSAAAKKLYDFISNKYFTDAMKSMQPFLSSISKYLSVVMDGRNLVSLSDALDELQVLFAALSPFNFGEIEQSNHIISNAVQKIPDSSKRNLISSSFGNILLSYPSLKHSSNSFKMFFDLFQSCIAISLYSNIKKLQDILEKHPHLKEMVTTTVPLEREFGYYKNKEQPLESGASVSTKMLAGSDKFSKSKSWEDKLSDDIKHMLFSMNTVQLDNFDANITRKS